MRTGIRMGAAVCDITPAADAVLAGGTRGRALGVLAPLTATALVFEGEGGGRAVALSCDVLGFETSYAAEARALLASHAGCGPEAVCLAGTHTHCGPATMELQCWHGRDDAYLARLTERLGGLVREAAGRMRAVRLRAAPFRLEGAAVNRTSYGCGVDDVCVATAAYSTDGELAGFMVSVGCHPVTLHGVDRVAPDFPGCLRDALARQSGRAVPTAFFLGAAGDVNPAGFVFHAEGVQDAAVRARAVSLAETLGARLAEAALAAVEGGARGGNGGGIVRAVRGCVDLPLLPYPTRAELDEQRAKCRAGVATADTHRRKEMEAHLAWCDMAERSETRKTLRVEIQAIRVGPALLLGLPCELFSAHGAAMRESVTDPLMIATLANGYAGYVCVPETHRRGAYEARGLARLLMRQELAPESGAVLRQAAIDLLRECAAGRE